MQVVLLILVVRVPMSKNSNKCVEFSMFFIILALLANTICGVIWLVKFQKENQDYLKTSYYVESIILLTIPIGIAVFFVIIFIAVICMLFFEHRRLRRMHRLEEEGMYDFEQMDEIADTYMRMLDQIIFERTILKYFECAICLKEFENGEQLY